MTQKRNSRSSVVSVMEDENLDLLDYDAEKDDFVEVEFKDLFRVIWKELRISFFCGLTLAFCNFLKLMYFDKVAMDVSLVISITLVLTIFLAKAIGSILPIFAEKFKMDPAVMASPLITTIVDAGSLMIYFKIACMLLNI